MENPNLDSVYPNLDSILKNDQKIKNFKFLFFTKNDKVWSNLGKNSGVKWSNQGKVAQFEPHEPHSFKVSHKGSHNNDNNTTFNHPIKSSGSFSTSRCFRTFRAFRAFRAYMLPKMVTCYQLVTCYQ